MSLPRPEAGLVIPYAYLWRHEHRKGQEEGRKVRPVVIVLAVQSPKAGAPIVTVAPITHTHPRCAIDRLSNFRPTSLKSG